MVEEATLNSGSDEEVLEETTAARKLTFSGGPHNSPNPQADQQTAVEVVQGNRQIQNGKDLNFYPPIVKNGQKIVQINPSEVEAERNKWENALIGYVIGDSPAFKDMLKFVDGVWKFVNCPTSIPGDA